MSQLAKALIAAAGNAGGDFYPYTIDYSCRFNSADSAVLYRQNNTAWSSNKIVTRSLWVKRTLFGARKQFAYIGNNGGSSNMFFAEFGPSDTIRIFFDGAGAYVLETSAVYRDASSWYHIVITADTTQATASNRCKLWVNGEQVTSFSTANYPPLNHAWNATTSDFAGIGGVFTSAYPDYYQAESYFIDGTAYDADTFGEFKNGVWIPKDASGSVTFGTQGTYCTFSNSSAFGTDSSGNGNTYTYATGLTSSDQMPDTPTNNFPTWNPLLKGISQTGTSTSDGNLVGNYTGGAGTGYWPTFSTMTLPKNGKVYFEMCLESVYNGALIMGIMSKEDAEKYAAGTQSPTLGNLGYWSIWNGDAYAWGGNGQPDYLTLGKVTNAGIAGGVVGFAIDLDAGKGWIRVNGTWLLSGNPANGTNPIGSDIHTGNGASASGEYVIWNSGYISLNAYTRSILNCGQDSTFSGRKTAGNYADENGIGDFLYSVPSGFLALCTANLPEPTIGPNSDTLPDEHFDNVAYTGNGASSRSITDLNFAPDFVWLKNRSAAYSHLLYDTIRGPSTSSASKALNSNATTTQGSANDNTTFGYLSAFNSNGFTVQKGTDATSYTNGSGRNYIAWNWKANGSGVSNTDGSITSTVSANQDAGISIVKYVGTANGSSTVGHGLGVAPACIIVNAYTSGGWVNYHASLGVNQYLELHSVGAAGISTGYWGTAVNSSVFGLSAGGTNNRSGASHIAYCFAEVEGFSKFASYTGNGSADGSFIFTGFRPAMVIVKQTNTARDWHIMDAGRDRYNIVNDILLPNSYINEYTDNANGLDFLSNGFKWRTGDAGFNGSGGTYIYMAFAENPFKYSNAR